MLTNLDHTTLRMSQKGLTPLGHPSRIVLTLLLRLGGVEHGVDHLVLRH
jgi:hypothetical protein